MADLTDREERAKEAKWYVVHTYSGYENKVKDNIEKMIENRDYRDDIFKVEVPTEEYLDSKGTGKVKERKLFPGYVLINMIINDESWYLVRNTRGVTGFVGPGSKPVPLSKEEVAALGVKDTLPAVNIDFAVNDQVKIVYGPFERFMGTVVDIAEDRAKVKVKISMFGRDTKVELDFDQVEKIN